MTHQFEQGSTIGYIGLGKMGQNMVARMRSFGYDVIATDPDEEARTVAEKTGAETQPNAAEVVRSLDAPRVVWLMVPHQVVDEVLEEIAPELADGDTVIEGGNSPYIESVRRADEFAVRGIKYVDVGVSGGPGGARDGACMMVGGVREEFERLEPLFQVLNVEGGYGYMGKSGAGHFVKMVHNGIEYGMMQAIAEGFHIMNRSEFDLDLAEVARVYAHGSVIESRLIDDTQAAYDQWGNELEGISGSAHASGEADWTVQAARELGVPRKIIAGALEARYESQREPNYQGRVIMALRNKFGGHEARTKED